MRCSGFIIAAAVLASSTSLAAAPVSLRAGESVTVAIDDGAVVSELSREQAVEPTPYERAVAQNLGGGKYAWATGPNAAPLRDADGLPTPDPVASGAVTIRFFRLPGGGALLVLHNGYDQGVKYRATMHRGDRAAPTDVCEVLPALRGFEHWPYEIERIELSDVKLIPWPVDRAPVCE